MQDLKIEIIQMLDTLDEYTLRVILTLVQNLVENR